MRPNVMRSTVRCQNEVIVPAEFEPRCAWPVGGSESKHSAGRDECKGAESEQLFCCGDKRTARAIHRSLSTRMMRRDGATLIRFVPLAYCH
uniref:Uncharacterized protein n=1 Tax=Plectus sambesii TaxID=2011161 RepID=A0A914VPX3_9BILA